MEMVMIMKRFQHDADQGKPKHSVKMWRDALAELTAFDFIRLVAHYIVACDAMTSCDFLDI